MPSVRTTLKWLLAVAPAFTVALPANDRIQARQASSSSAASSAAAAATSVAAAPAAPAAGGGLSDVDILQFALTAEHLESTFYKMGFAKFPASDFQALGLSDSQIKTLTNVGQTEATHVTTLLSAISATGTKPVEPCEYNFDAALADAKTMVATARVLEAVGVSAYLGAAPLVNSSDVLSAAASILTVEARHQAFIRVASGAEPVPAAFDTALGPTAVFTLAAQFIKSCPEGSNLAITPFPAINLQNAAAAVPGQNLKLADAAQPAGAQFCAFVAPGGNQFAQLNGGSCTVPQGLQGEVYMMITKSQSIADTEVLAGPSVIQPS
ncbi:ferritin-like domain-containing protein [Lophiotrema nucula]|uniref:Ferritin-like domain-containing protein n=1 Tax=Lophiotrema nucula TaxID=690887 RepID=A0A6A5ZNB4_9PLEO|nr:ferritin-like domain-containing protein [Lophiotrema nucula]